VLKYDGKNVIHIRIPPSSDVHWHKKSIYDRVNDSDMRITGTKQIRAMCYRKQKFSTENIVYPHIKENDLRLDMLKTIRQMAVNHRRMKFGHAESHPWENMTDKELLKSAKLYDVDSETEKWGYNLAAVVLLGKDDLISSIVPSYRTDALLRKVNVDRYDDREMITTNLIDSYYLLMDFAAKHLLDKFYLEDDKRVSLRTIITREMLVNTLMHREMTSSISARFIIEKDRMFTENANRADKNSKLTPDNFTSNSKNPIIAAFFRNIGMADELGSGVRNLYHYTMRYSGKLPEMIEDDVFRTIIPLDDEYSYDVELKKLIEKAQSKHTTKSVIDKEQNKRTVEATILEMMQQNPKINAIAIAEELGMGLRNTRRYIQSLKEMGSIEYIGKTRGGHWIVKTPSK